MDTLDSNNCLKIIEEIRNTEKWSIDRYIEDRLIPIQKENPEFIKTLQKDISYILEWTEKSVDNDISIKDWDSYNEDGGIKLTGSKAGRYDVVVSSHQEIIKEILKKAESREFQPRDRKF